VTSIAAENSRKLEPNPNPCHLEFYNAVVKSGKRR